MGASTNSSEAYGGENNLAGGDIEVVDAADWVLLEAGANYILGGKTTQTGGSEAIGGVVATFGGSYDGADFIGGDVMIGAGVGTSANGSVFIGSFNGSALTPALIISTTSITAELPVILKGYTVATLPTGTQGMKAFVTDATTPTYNTALTGGGAVVVPVFFNGTIWVSA